MNKIFGITLSLILITTTLTTVYTSASEINSASIGNFATLNYYPTSNDFGSKDVEHPVQESTTFQIWKSGGHLEIPWSQSIAIRGCLPGFRCCRAQLRRGCYFTSSQMFTKGCTRSPG